MSDDLFVLAIGLLLVVEGIFPFVVPALWRKTYRRLSELNDGQIRFMGITSMLMGLALLFLFK